MAEKPTIMDRREARIGQNPQSATHGSKSDFIKNPKEGFIPSYPGEYELKKLTITSPNRKGYIDLKAAWSDFNIYEDIFGNYLTGNIQIVDGVGLMESVPLIGEETLHIQVKTTGLTRQRNQNTIPGPFEGSQNEGLIDLQFRVVKISGIRKLNEGILTYKLSFSSEEAILNLKQKVKKSALDPVSLEPRKISDVVKSLYRQFFQRGRVNAKRIFIEPTKNLTDLIIPNQTPFKAFEFLASRSVSAGKHAAGSSYVFYESTRGFFFISMETLMAGGGLGYSTVAGSPGSPTELVYNAPEEPVKEVYVVQPKRLGVSNDSPTNVAIEMTAVDDYTFSANFDVLENLTSGMYANRLLTHDLVRMKYDTLDFNLVDPTSLGAQTRQTPEGATEVLDFQTLAADAKNFSDSFTHLGTGKLATEKQDALGAPESVVSFYPSNFAHDVRFKEDLGSKGVKGGNKAALNIQPNRVEQWMQSRMVQSQQATNIKLNIRAPGLSTRAVGDLIEFKLPTTYLEDRDGVTQSQHHTYLSGYYLITKLRHHFTRDKYEIEFEAIKDSLKVPPGRDRSVSPADDTSTVTSPAQG
jgi:hypothetical protein